MVAGLSLWLAIALFVVLALTAFLVVSRFKYVDDDETFATGRGFKKYHRALRPGGWRVLSLTEFILKGDRHSRFPFGTRGTGAEKTKEAYLRNSKTGEIDLTDKQCAVRFRTSTKDSDVEIQITATIEFCVDWRTHQSLHNRGDQFGGVLQTKVQEAIRNEVNQKTTLEIQQQRETILDAFLTDLQKVQADLGIQFKKVDEFYYTQVTSPAGARPIDPAGAEEIPEDTRPALGRGVAYMREDQLKRIMELFPDSSQQVGLIAILEMQTRLDVAEALAKSKQLVVVTAQELGLVGSAVQLDAIRRPGSPLGESIQKK